MKFQVHLTDSDEESGTFSRLFVGHVVLPDTLDLSTREGYLTARQIACERLAACYYSDFTSVHFAPVGVRVRRSGSLSQAATDRLCHSSVKLYAVTHFTLLNTP